MQPVGLFFSSTTVLSLPPLQGVGFPSLSVRLFCSAIKISRVLIPISKILTTNKSPSPQSSRPDKGRFLTFPKDKTRKRGKIGRQGRLFSEKIGNKPFFLSGNRTLLVRFSSLSWCAFLSRGNLGSLGEGLSFEETSKACTPRRHSLSWSAFPC